MPQTHFDHGGVPLVVAGSLVCPAQDTGLHDDAVGERVEYVEGSGYRAKFRCAKCRFEFTISDAQLRRIGVPQVQA